MTRIAPATDLTEKEFTRQIVELATVLGWKRYHTWRSKHSAAGYPDETLVRERLIFAEVKRQGGKPTAEQVEWLTALARAGVETYLWMPDDLQEIGKVLGTRAHFVRANPHNRPPWDQGYLFTDTRGEALFQPRSLWLPAGHRADQDERKAA